MNSFSLATGAVTLFFQLETVMFPYGPIYKLKQKFKNAINWLDIKIKITYVEQLLRESNI